MSRDEIEALVARAMATRCHGTCDDTDHRMIDALCAEVELLRTERDALLSAARESDATALRVIAERDEARAQLAALREACEYEARAVGGGAMTGQVRGGRECDDGSEGYDIVIRSCVPAADERPRSMRVPVDVWRAWVRAVGRLRVPRRG